jgi:hypothetical protein
VTDTIKRFKFTFFSGFKLKVGEPERIENVQQKLIES